MRAVAGRVGVTRHARSTTVGVLYPPRFHSDPAAYDAAVARLAADPRLTVLAEPYEDDAALRTRRSRPGYERAPGDDTPLTSAQLAVFERIDVALALDLPFDVDRVAPRLRWVQAAGAGIGQLRTAGLQRGGVRLTNASGAAAPEIAEFVLGRILQHRKRFDELAELQRAHEWRPRYGRSLVGATIGLVGVGSINSAVARLAHAFGMVVLASRRDVRAGRPEGVDELFAAADLHDMVARCDVVVAALPETDETVGCFDAACFAAMPPGSFFCNVGRGSAVVDSALREALVSGHLGGAALDVFGQEPLDPDDPYWSTPRLQISAHCSSVPAASIAAVHSLFDDNLGRFLSDAPLVNEVDLSRGY